MSQPAPESAHTTGGGAVDGVAGGTNFILFDLRALTHFDAKRPQITTLAETGAARLILIAFRAGQELPMRQTTSETSVQALRGRLRLSVGASSAELISGRLAQIEERTPYQLYALSDVVALLTLTPSPGEAAPGDDPLSGARPLVIRA